MRIIESTKFNEHISSLNDNFNFKKIPHIFYKPKISTDVYNIGFLKTLANGVILD